MKTIVFLIALVTGSAHAEIGFKNGNNVTSVLSQGEITVHCQASGPGGGPATSFYRCEQDILVSGEYDYFRGPEGVNADEVTLVAFHQDGSQRTKSVAYDSKKGQSAKSINLWIYTLLQRPLLEMGTNRVTYSMTLNGKRVSQGEFVATVRDGGVKTCSHPGTYWSGVGSGCQSAAVYCNQYFSENNYCL